MLKAKVHLEDTTVDSKIILKRILGKENWIHQNRDRDQWRALANKVVNLLLP
jgi:hypothetical protein